MPSGPAQIAGRLTISVKTVETHRKVLLPSAINPKNLQFPLLQALALQLRPLPAE